VGLARRGDGVVELSIQDQGIGLPQDFDLGSATGFGMRIIQAMAKQLRAQTTVRRLDPGTEFSLIVPLQPS
jgi:two-component sensor histidine kinase